MEIELIFKKLLQLKTESAILYLIKEEGKPESGSEIKEQNRQETEWLRTRGD